MLPQLVLVSHALCPYVQRVAIVLLEKGVPFARRDIDLAAKPEWFLAISPLGKTPVLLVDSIPIFESAVICEYLEDVFVPRLHPQDPLQRAQHRAWTEFSSTVLNAIGRFYSAADEVTFQVAMSEMRRKFAQLEAALTLNPYFGGESFSLVDAAFGPVFRYFEVFEGSYNVDFFSGLPRVQAWRSALASRTSVKAAVSADYGNRLKAFLTRKPSVLSTRMVGNEDRLSLLLNATLPALQASIEDEADRSQTR